jgi:hypothetical protein
MKILIGSDPELFVLKDGEPSSAIGMVGGDKKNPVACDGGALQEDNVLLEFNTDPTSCPNEFVNTMHRVLGEARKVANAHDHEIEIASSHEYTRDFLMNQPSKAMEFGCTPDYNCLDASMNRSPNPFTTLRTAGGHVHIGWGDGLPEDSTTPEQLSVARMADYLLGVWSVLHDTDTRRRELYGAAGAYRPKKYGIEYRTMSNFWLRSPELIREVHKRSQACYSHHEYLSTFMVICSHEEVQRAINESDIELCTKINTYTEEVFLND